MLLDKIVITRAYWQPTEKVLHAITPIAASKLLGN